MIDYVRLSVRTIRMLSKQRPFVLWMQLPPVPLLWTAALYRRFMNPRLKLVADCHNAMFHKKWSRVPLGVSLLNRCDLVIVHNENVHSSAEAAGVSPEKLFVLEDVPPLSASDEREPKLDIGRNWPRPWILFPGSFGEDEPIAELVQAARLQSKWTFIVTGKLANAKRYGHDLSGAPSNIFFPGYLPAEHFDQLLRLSDIVLALTRYDGVQLSVCNEALGFGKAMVVSDTPLLRRLFGSAAVLVDSGRSSRIVEAIATAMRSREQLEAAASRLAIIRRHAAIMTLAKGPSWLTGKGAR